MIEESLVALGVKGRGRAPKRATGAPKREDVLIVGFDSEFTARPSTRAHRRANELVCFQLVTMVDGKKKGILIPWQEMPSCDNLYGTELEEFMAYVWRKLPPCKKAVLYTYFSHAEYSVLNVHTLDPRVTFTPNGGDTFALKWDDEQTGIHIEICDLKAFFPHQSLDGAAKDFGFQKLPYDRANIDRDSLLDPTFKEYALRDAELCFHMAVKLRAQIWDEFQIDVVKNRTPASIAALTWRRTLEAHLGCPVSYVRNQAMRSYWGGNNQAYYRGRYDGELRIYDAVSMYPSAAIALGVLPRGSDWVPLTRGNLSRVLGGVCRVRFEFPADEHRPCLPVWAGNGLAYPLTGVSDCTVHEVRYALEKGATVSLIDGYGYTGGDDSVARYSAAMLEKKNAADASGNTAQRTIYKLLLNSLYGKFGQRRVEYTLDQLRAYALELEMPDVQTLLSIPNWQDMYVSCTGRPRPEPEVTVGPCWLPEWAAIINGYARMVECRAMDLADALAGSTDSVITAQDLGDGFELCGVRFKLEFTAKKGTIIKNRTYAFEAHDGTVRAALHGAPRYAENDPGTVSRVLLWYGEDTIKIPVRRIRKLKDGLSRGGGVGMHYERTEAIVFAWDNKRELAGDRFTRPHKEIPCVTQEISRLLVPYAELN